MSAARACVLRGLEAATNWVCTLVCTPGVNAAAIIELLLYVGQEGRAQIADQANAADIESTDTDEVLGQDRAPASTDADKYLPQSESDIVVEENGEIKYVVDAIVGKAQRDLCAFL